MVALVKRNANRLSLLPFYSPLSLLEEVENMTGLTFETGLTPEIDVYEEEKELVIKSELPGIRKRDLDIRLDGDVLTIKTRKEEEKEVEEGYFTHERHFGQYVRYMTLPTRVDAEKITATLKKGLLVIRLPKAEVPETKKIEVKTK
jgi:HSP20 family protein